VTIHHVINDGYTKNGGAERVARLLHQELQSRQLASRLVSVVHSDGNGASDCLSLGLASPYDIRAVWRLALYMKRECRRGDVIHAHLFPSNLYASLSARIVGWQGRLVCTEHSTSNRRRGTLPGWATDRVTYSRYDHVACISAGTRDALAAWMPTITQRLVVIENGVPLVFKQVPLRLPREKPIVVSVGTLRRAKNYDVAIKALSLLKELPFEYRIAGTGPEEHALRSLCEQLQLTDRIRFLGFVEDVPQLLRETDIFLMPSRWEGFGLAAVEAMNAGLPLIASDVEGLREIVAASPPCGIFVDPSDPSSIAQALRELLVDPEKRQSYGQAAHRRSQQFSLDRMVEKYLDFYNSL
jgi:glycosyltransferase involved in cell wall biosynthesis